MNQKHDDPLGNEISVSAELTETGVEAHAKSRALSGFDRLCGNFTELLNVPMERLIAKGRTEIEARRQISNAITAAAIKEITGNPEFARRAIEAHLDQILRKQKNKDAVVIEAMEHLKLAPINEIDSKSGSDTLDDVFLGRLEYYAEGATTYELRQKWGRILSQEIRKPGTFSTKVLRIIDELGSETAKLFEAVCDFRLFDCLPMGSLGQLKFEDAVALTSAGLMVDPLGEGQLRSFVTHTLDNGTETWLCWFGTRGVAFDRKTQFTTNQSTTFSLSKGVPYLRMYFLTDAGAAISTILRDREDVALSMIGRSLANALPAGTQVWTVTMDTQSEKWKIVESFVAPIA